MIELDLRFLGAAAFVLGGLYLLFRWMGSYASRKLTALEFEHVLNSDEHKVRGRFE